MQGCFSTTVHFLTLYVPNELQILKIYEMHQPFLHIFCYTCRLILPLLLLKFETEAWVHIILMKNVLECVRRRWN